MTKPSLVRDADGSQWALQSDGTYNIRDNGRMQESNFVRDFYRGYSLERIEEEFGIIGKTYDTPSGDQDYSFLRSR